MELSIQNISKTYSNGVKALENICLELRSGMFGLLGPNGAGKSSLMRTIATLQFPDTGKIEFNGLDMLKDKTDFRKRLGYLPQDFGVYPKESASSLLNYLALLKGISSRKERKIRVDQVLEITNLESVKNKYVSTFSGGMKQRFGIAQLLLNQPSLIIVDEPTAGLDPAERARFLNVLRQIGSENIVIFSTHLVEDVKALCKDMAIMDKGKLLKQIDPKSATANLSGKIWETTLNEQALNRTLPSFIKLSDRYNEDNHLVHRIYAAEAIGAFGYPVDPKLEDYYFLTLKYTVT